MKKAYLVTLSIITRVIAESEEEARMLGVKKTIDEADSISGDHNVEEVREDIECPFDIEDMEFLMFPGIDPLTAEQEARAQEAFNNGGVYSLPLPVETRNPKEQAIRDSTPINPQLVPVEVKIARVFNNFSLELNIEKILTAEALVIEPAENQGRDFTIHINNHTFIYRSKEERDQDYDTLLGNDNVKLLLKKRDIVQA